MQPKSKLHKYMKFKENHKTALAKVLSDLVQCDGIVNQGEIEFLQRVYEAFGITSTSRKKATTLSLSDAVNILRTLGNCEKAAVLRLFQALSLSDDALDPNESLLSTALLLSIGIELPETQDINAYFVSIPNLNFDTRNAVLYVEPKYDKAVNDSILRDYDTICKLLNEADREFFYLPMVLRNIGDKRATFLKTLSYIEPTLSNEQLDQIGSNLDQMDSAFLSKEIFLNYLNTNRLNINKPAFFFRIGDKNANRQQDFLILEIENDPLATLQHFLKLKDNIVSLEPESLNPKDKQFMQLLTLMDNGAKKEELNYTGFHKILIDTILKYTGSHEVSRLYVTKHGDLFLTDRNNAEVKLPALAKALYILFLLHEEGIPLNYLNDYKPELYRIYRKISTYGDVGLLNQAVDNLTDFVGNTMNVALSRIKKSFTDLLGPDAMPYLIQGKRAGRKAIPLERRLVVFENRESFV